MNKSNPRLNFLAAISGVMIALQARANGELSHRMGNPIEYHFPGKHLEPPDKETSGCRVDQMQEQLRFGDPGGAPGIVP